MTPLDLEIAVNIRLSQMQRMDRLATPYERKRYELMSSGMSEDQAEAKLAYMKEFAYAI